MSVKEYSLEFTKLSKYASSLVLNDRDEMSRYVTGESKELEEKYCSAMLHDNMDLCILIINA